MNRLPIVLLFVGGCAAQQAAPSPPPPDAPAPVTRDLDREVERLRFQVESLRDRLNDVYLRQVELEQSVEELEQR